MAISSDKSALQSKKFVAYAIAEVTWKILAVVVLIEGKDMIPGGVFGILMTIIIIAGFIEAMYIGGQAVLDRYIQVAKLATDVAKNVVDKAAENMPSKEEPVPAPKKPTPKKP